MAEDTTNLVTINIDGKDYQVAAKQNLVDAAQSVGIEIPHYCYHPKLPMAGSCRMCLVEIGMPMRDRATGEPVIDEATGKQKIGWMPKPAIACGTSVSPGLHVKLNSKMTVSSREGVTEFLLANHPLDCPICDQAGECTLQEFSSQYGKGVSRYRDAKNVKPKHKSLGPQVMYDGERCIRCTRCVRFCRDILGRPVLGVTQRGSHSEIDCYPGTQLDGNYTLNVVDVCPVGAMTSKDFRFKMRVWFLKKSKSICTESSVGVNTTVWSREGKIYRITPRENDAVNVAWMSDSGRMLYKTVEAETRLTGFRRGESEVTFDEAADAALALLKNGASAFVASGKMSVEEQFVLKSLAAAVGGNVYLAKTLGENDAMLISEDRTPNRRGALVTGLVKDFDGADVSALAAKIEADEVKTVFVCGEDLSALGLTEEQIKKVDIVYLGTQKNATSEEASVVLPSRTVFEKAGTFINQEFRLQKFEAAIPGIKGTESDLTILSTLAARASSSVATDVSVASVWEKLRAACPVLANVDYAKIPDTGTLLDASPWANIAFPETGSLKWKPAK
ncbi:MAG: 2Fe-2S iron-sulfur cluster binding domain-containing protein [Verrucomicrobia bacterium]|nr:2Fe-2S iron-sulfur cluster binding domain-containing protein [Verrucomicrobiota bacterium]